MKGRTVASTTPTSATCAGAPENKILKYYFDVAYFLLCSPFRLKLSQRNIENGTNSRKPKYEVTSWLPQKLICFLGVLLQFFWYISEIRTSFDDLLKAKDPKGYFQFFAVVVTRLFKVAVLKRIWWNSHDFAEIVNFPMADLVQFHSRKTVLRFFTRRTKLAVALIIGIFLCLETGMIVTGTTGHYKTVLVEGGAFSNWWRGMVLAGRKNFFVPEKHFNFNGRGGDEDGSALAIALGILALIGLTLKRFMAAFNEMVILFPILVLWLATKSLAEYAEQIQPELGPGLHKALRQTTAIRQVKSPASDQALRNLGTESFGIISNWLDHLWKLSDLVNQAIGHLVTLYIFDCILFNTIYLDQVFQQEVDKETLDWGKLLLVFFYFFSGCVILGLAAESCYEIDKVRRWLHSRKTLPNVPTSKLLLTLDKLDTDLVSIKASNIFPVTYSLLANVVGVNVTYFIICVQSGQ